jgi:hypothetical protein
MRGAKSVTVGVCCITRYSEDYIEEWLAFHIAQGVTYFLIIDNGDSAELRQILRPYVAEGIVEVVTFVGIPGPQVLAYNLALQHVKKHRKNIDWLAVIDGDEFLFSPDGTPLPEFFSTRMSQPGVGANWVSFGSSGHQTKPAGLVIESYTNRGPDEHEVPYEHMAIGTHDDGSIRYRPMNAHIKSIVQPGLAVRALNPHEFSYRRNGFTHTAEGVPFRGPWAESVSNDRLRIHHYWSRSREELLAKAALHRVDNDRQRTEEEALRRDAAASGITDDTILRWVPRVREIMADFAARRATVPEVVARPLASAKEIAKMQAKGWA